MARIPELYGSRFFDILLLDALYAQAPVLELAQKIGWDLVISWKQNSRELYPSAIRLLAHRPPAICLCDQREGKAYQVQLWQTDGLPFSGQHPQPLRVVRSEETLVQNHYRERQLLPETTEHEGLWRTTLDSAVFSAPQVRRLGHDRWKLENNGGMDLTMNWGGKHGFLHACRHRPKRISASGPRLPVPNRGLAVTLILFLAFTLCSAFALRHSKLVRRYHLAAVAVARQLYTGLSQAPPSIRAPD